MDMERLGALTDELRKYNITLRDIQVQGVKKTDRVEQLLSRGIKFPIETITQEEFLDLWFILGWNDSKIADKFNKKRGKVAEQRKQLGITEETALILLLERILKEKQNNS